MVSLHPTLAWRLAENAIVAGDVSALERLFRDYEAIFRKGPPPSSWSGGLRPDYEAGSAQAVVARTHGFKTWDDYAGFAALAKDEHSPVARFEAAADSVVAGDVAGLERMLREDPALIRARSIRPHRSTLLHYVGANGVEPFRQWTPGSATHVLEMLLAAGAAVDAVADMYGGSTTLGLVATSIHPKLAGLSEPLMEILLAHGATIDHRGPLVNACLANGREEAAQFLVGKGAMLDLEGACGVGRLDVVRGFFRDDGTLETTATRKQMADGFSWACEYGRLEVVEFLLDRGMDVGARLRPHGQTGLHWAVWGGHREVVEALLARRAPLEVKDESYQGTPLGWVLYHWGGLPEPSANSIDHYEIVERLIRAGSTVDWEWLAGANRGTPLAEKIRADSKMLAALTA